MRWLVSWPWPWPWLGSVRWYAIPSGYSLLSKWLTLPLAMAWLALVLMLTLVLVLALVPVPVHALLPIMPSVGS